MKNIRNQLFWSGILTGIVIRFVLMYWGHNFDFESYCIVGELAASGNNVYAFTSRYNYGPIWFILLGTFWKLAAGNILLFRIFIVSTLTLCDFLIAKLISQKAGNFWGLIFFLNPISLIITGYHNQFDNIAVLFGAYAVSCLEKSADERDFKAADIYGTILLSFSLITKHILFAFPLWVLLNKKIDARKKFLYAFIPPLIFLISFIPYWAEGSQGILNNVFLYKSFNNFPLLGLGVFNHLGMFLPYQKYICLPAFIVLMVGCAYCFRREEIYDLFLLYIIALVCFSSAIANQYIVIPCMALIILLRKKSALYFLLGLLFLSLNKNGLHILLWLENNYGIKFSFFDGINLNFFIRILGSGTMYTPFAWCLLYYLIYYYRHKNNLSTNMLR